jgi:hypothetical protein
MNRDGKYDRMDVLFKMGDMRKVYRNFVECVCKENWRKYLDRMPTG